MAIPFCAMNIDCEFKHANNTWKVQNSDKGNKGSNMQNTFKFINLLEFS